MKSTGTTRFMSKDRRIRLYGPCGMHWRTCSTGWSTLNHNKTNYHNSMKGILTVMACAVVFLSVAIITYARVLVRQAREQHPEAHVHQWHAIPGQPDWSHDVWCPQCKVLGYDPDAQYQSGDSTRIFLKKGEIYSYIDSTPISYPVWKDTVEGGHP